MVLGGAATYHMHVSEVKQESAGPVRMLLQATNNASHIAMPLRCPQCMQHAHP